MIALINYDRGNLRSVSKALEKAGATVQLVASGEELANSDAQAVVLPGVGSYGDAAHNLQQRNLWEPLKEWIAAGKPFLGICLGYQLLFESSEETPGVPGLGVFAGEVVRFPEKQETGLKVPHMGWNRLEFTQPDCPLWDGLPADKTNVYFVHSYFPRPADASLISARTAYGPEFAASIARDNVFATQFHPEKSQAVGLRMLSNFLQYVGQTRV